MQLSELIAGLDIQLHNMKDVQIKAIEFDSRKVEPGALYIALRGAQHDGHDFIGDVEGAGAAAVVTERRVATNLPQLIVDDTRKIVNELAARFYGDFYEMKKVGVTGTNGKTTTTFLIRSILVQSGRNPGLIGTVYYLGARRDKAVRTTPEILDILKLLKEFTEQGVDSLVMEVSSHALKLGRVEGMKFDAAVFTNLSRDHLDFHATMEDYRRSKLRLFSLLKPDGCAIYNNDEEIRDSVRAMELPRSLSFGKSEGSDLRGRIIEQSIDGLRVEIYHEGESHDIRSRLVGEFNIYNILAAFATGVSIGVKIGDVIKGIEKLTVVPGRMERVVDNVFVDYAHTPAAVKNVLEAGRKYTKGKLIIVFGCGGDRDREKRPEMGTIATELADLAIITTDNPRGESPSDIIENILQGMTSSNYRVVEDRAAAIEYAINLKTRDDMVIVAGKGHEEYQLFKDERIEFSDAEVIKRCFENSR
jgi:UDP-N-acetylmuramoyl-L-alanyl-D-glutamate--2,6-diaminopimelate ligase